MRVFVFFACTHIDVNISHLVVQIAIEVIVFFGSNRIPILKVGSPNVYIF